MEAVDRREAPLTTNTNGLYRILAIDGGPAAPVQIRMMRRLEQAYPGFLASTHQFAGTSDGALIALFLASRLPRDPETAKRISLDVLDDAIAFSDATIRALQPTTYSILRFLSGMGAVVDPSPLRRVLEHAFGDMKLADLERDCAITSFNVDDMQGESILKLGKFCPVDRNIVDALLATTALPMYMPLHNIDGRRYVDGVITANDSSFNAVVGTAMICGFRAEELAQNPSSASDLSPALEAMVARAKSSSLEEACTGFRILSLGLKEKNRSVYVSETLMRRFFGDQFDTYEKDSDWGWFHWLLNRPRLLPAMIYAANNDNMAFLCNRLFSRRYLRYEPGDDVISDAWRVLSRNAQTLFDNAEKLVDSLWKEGIERKSPDGSLPATSILMDFVKSEWLDAPPPVDEPPATAPRLTRRPKGGA